MTMNAHCCVTCGPGAAERGARGLKPPLSPPKGPSSN